MDYSLPGSSVHGILQARILQWVAISFSTKWGLMASTSLDREGAQERQRLLKFSPQGLMPRKSSIHSKLVVSSDQEHSRGPAAFPEGKEQGAHLPSLTEGWKILVHRLSLRKQPLQSTSYRLSLLIIRATQEEGSSGENMELPSVYSVWPLRLQSSPVETYRDRN